jgi:hypothetical protein
MNPPPRRPALDAEIAEVAAGREGEQAVSLGSE